jgi:TolB-like protein
VLSVPLYLHYRVRPRAILVRSSVPVQLAVLPFAPTTNDPNSKAFGDGLTETLTAKLAQLSGNYPCRLVGRQRDTRRGRHQRRTGAQNFGVGLVLEETCAQLR